MEWLRFWLRFGHGFAHDSGSIKIVDRSNASSNICLLFNVFTALHRFEYLSIPIDAKALLTPGQSLCGVSPFSGEGPSVASAEALHFFQWVPYFFFISPLLGYGFGHGSYRPRRA
ncbi:MAG TPA: hypothetical protein VFJ56_04820, partial [Nitrospira sp.]|nr:hypothetical protein [Nitrospira sp.]